MKKEIFLPPGVQAKILDRFGRCPREADDEVADQIDALWQRRSTAPEEELASIDQQIEDFAATIPKPSTK
jgi:hypothetical protein